MKKGLMLIVFIGLLWCPTGYSQEAWILWQKTSLTGVEYPDLNTKEVVTDPKYTSWRLWRAVPDHQTCLYGAKKYPQEIVMHLRPGSYDEQGTEIIESRLIPENPYMFLMKTKGVGIIIQMHHEFLCFPASFDPRGK